MRAKFSTDASKSLRDIPSVSPSKDALDLARVTMEEAGQWNTSQFMGRRFAIGCVALEITQRCNLDCSACYLSEHSEAVKDVPIEELFRRIDGIRTLYGPNVDIQITGGDPTLRKEDELVAIVQYIRKSGMRPALFTNGIRATRALLARLAEAGLVDVAFHVDLTQDRKGYETESDLNALRRSYIERVRGLPLAVYFNTTVFNGNFAQIRDVVAFFVEHSDIVQLASFQPQAETGRGTLDPRAPAITTRSVIGQIEAGAEARLSFDTAQIGHSLCNRYAMVLVVNGRVHDMFDDPALFNAVLAATAKTSFDRHNRARAILAVVAALAKQPGIFLKSFGWATRKVWAMKAYLIASRGRANKLSFYIHNFMDACDLDPTRLKSCVFMAATQDGPVSMCLHNARRDAEILRPVELGKSDGKWFWDPISGKLSRQLPTVRPPKPGSVGLRRNRRKAESPSEGAERL